MKIFKLLFLFFLVIYFSCSNNQNGEKLNNKEIEKEINDNVKFITKKQDKNIVNDDKSIVLNQFSDEELVNRASQLQIEAGGNPISVEDTLKLEKAINYFKKAIEININNEAAYTNMVTVLCILERYREALKVLEKSTKRKANFAEGYTYQGFILEKLEILDSSQIMYQKAISAYDERIKKSRNLNDEINRAFLLFFTKGKEEALKEIDNIIKNNPNNEYALNMQPAFENFNRKEFIEENLK